MANKKRTQNKRAGKKQRRRTAAKQRGGDYTYKTIIRYNKGPDKITTHASKEEFNKTCENYAKMLWDVSYKTESGNIKVCYIQELGSGM